MAGTIFELVAGTNTYSVPTLQARGARMLVINIFKFEGLFLVEKREAVVKWP